VGSEARKARRSLPGPSSMTLAPLGRIFLGVPEWGHGGQGQLRPSPFKGFAADISIGERGNAPLRSIRTGGAGTLCFRPEGKGESGRLNGTAKEKPRTRLGARDLHPQPPRQRPACPTGIMGWQLCYDRFCGDLAHLLSALQAPDFTTWVKLAGVVRKTEGRNRCVCHYDS